MTLFAGLLYFTAGSLNVLSQPDMQTYAYLTKVADQALGKRAAEVAKLSAPEQLLERQKRVRNVLASTMGTWPAKTPLNPRITGVLRRGGYRVEKVIFESSPKLYVAANLYIPEQGQGPFPAVLGAAGHGDDGKSAGIYQRAWISLAQRGFVVLAWDPIQQGERTDYLDSQGRPRIPPGTQQHAMTGLPILLTGDTLARYFVWDGIRALDYLLTRQEVDPKRIAVAGNSGGGTQAAMLAAVDPRLAAAVSSCYMTTSAELWRSTGPTDSEQMIPSFISEGLDFADFALAAGPQPFLIESAIRDYFPIAGARATYRESKRFYELLGHPDRLSMFEYDDKHGWSKPRREAMYRWLERLFLNRDAAPEAADLKVESEADLLVTPSGRVAELGGETVASLNAKRADEVYRSRKPLSSANAAQILSRRLVIRPRETSVPNATDADLVSQNGYTVRKLRLTGSDGFTVPALLFEPASPKRKRSAVLWFDGAGMAHSLGEIEAVVRQGEVVLAVDPRGFGELRHDPIKERYSQHGTYSLSMRAVLLGKTLIGMAVEDLRTAADYLAAQSSVNKKRIRVVGVVAGAVGVLYLAVLDGRIKEVELRNAPTSYRAFTTGELHAGLADILVPGVLADFDLPDLVKILGSRKVHVVSSQVIARTGNKLP